MEARRIVVKGRVQGVGFRAFVLRLALEHGVVGEVWNTRDGDVAIIAQSDSLDAFMSALRFGPGLVTGVGMEAVPITEYHSFSVSHTR